MIVDNGKYYLYRHIRLDKNEPFYIGIGTKSKYKHRSFKREYDRAHRTDAKGKIWNDIVNKSKYEIEILLETNSYEFIKEKEVEFIKSYGRIDLGTGILSNLTDGGEGTKGAIVSEDTRQYKSINSHSRGKFGKNSYVAVPVFQYNEKGEFIKKFDCIVEAARELNVSPSSIGSNLRNKSFSCLNCRWFHTYLGLKVDPIRIRKNEKRVVQMLHLITGDILKEFCSTVEAAKYVNSDAGSINHAIKGRKGRSVIKHCKGYKWKYK